MPIELLAILFFVFLVLFCVLGYNKLVAERLKILEAEANVDVYLYRRFEEVNTLYRLVKEYQTYEHEILEKIVKLRNTLFTLPTNFKERNDIMFQTEKQIAEIITNLENYPELRTNENFLQLQQRIAENEENISAARSAYNSFVRKYNTSISLFPLNLLAKLLRFEKVEFFEAPENTKKNQLF